MEFAFLDGLAREAGRPPVVVATDILAAKRSNDRARVDRVWQVDRATLSALAVRRCLLGMDANDPDDRLLDWLWAMLTLPTWAVSAHLPQNDLPALGKPTLDLAACEMAALLAEAREVLRPWMDATSKTLAGSVLAEIDRQVLTPYAAGAYAWWDDHNSRELNNWAGVCAGSILAACESLAAQGEPRPAARERALKGLGLFFDRGFTPRAECDEGVMYWIYGVEFACVGLSRLGEEELRGAIDFERFCAVADYPRRAHLFGDTFFSGNDAGMRAWAPRGFVPWLAGATDNAFLAWWAREHGTVMARHFGQMLRGLAARAESGAAAPPAPTAVEWLEDQQAMIVRVAAPGGPLTVCLTGGTNDERHNHNDLGHFVVALGERLVVPDLGAPHYAADFFGPRRYTYLPASSRGHCCPVVNGHEQRAGTEVMAGMLKWSGEPAAPTLTLDLTAAYPADAGLTRWVRELACDAAAGRAVIRDAFAFADDERRQVTQVVWTLERPQFLGSAAADGAALARLGPVVLEVRPAPDEIRVELVQPERLNLRDYAGQTLCRIEMVYERVPVDGRTEMTFRVAEGEEV